MALKSNLIKHSYPKSLIDKTISNFLNNKYNSNHRGNLNQVTHYFSLPYIGKVSDQLKIKLHKLAKKYCKDEFHFKLAFTSFKIKHYFSYKDRIPEDIQSLLVYHIICARCGSSYVGETTRHFKTRINEHILTDKGSHIFQHLKDKPDCFDSVTRNCFKVVDRAKNAFDLKIKESLHIKWLKPNLNSQVNHVALTLSL